MSASLSFESDPVDQPAATDPLERVTWCALCIRVGTRFASRIWDKTLQSERTTLYVPAFPLAQWLVQNSWSLLNELCIADTIPKSEVGPLDDKWIRRHCLRSADSSLLLPAIYVFHCLLLGPKSVEGVRSRAARSTKRACEPCARIRRRLHRNRRAEPRVRGQRPRRGETT